MNLTDIPQSDQYLQQGAITQLVVQIVDQVTGLPVPLQTATAMTIVIGYPDRITQQSFSASLYGDGSDGRIVYTTRNNGTNIIDLSQDGLYQIQGIAYIGGVPQVSELGDFYCLPNIAGGATPPNIYQASAVILFDPTGARWAMTVQTNGTIIFTATPSGPANFLQFNHLVMKDSSGVYWTVTMNANGTYTAVQGGTFPQALQSFMLVDSSGKAWIITINTSGILQAA